MSPQLKEALKELARVAVLATLPVIIFSLEAGETDYRVLTVSVLVAVMRAVDKYLHGYEDEGRAGGLLGF